jgi:hypothetical protein
MLRPRLARLVTALAVLGTTVAPASARAQSADAKADDGRHQADVRWNACQRLGLVHGTFHPQLRMVTVGKGREGRCACRWRKAPRVPQGHRHAAPRQAGRADLGRRVEIDGALASVWVDYNLYVGDKFMHCGIDHFLLVRGDDAAWKIISLADTRRTEGCKP